MDTSHTPWNDISHPWLGNPDIYIFDICICLCVYINGCLLPDRSQEMDMSKLGSHCLKLTWNFPYHMYQKDMNLRTWLTQMWRRSRFQFQTSLHRLSLYHKTAKKMLHQTCVMQGKIYFLTKLMRYSPSCHLIIAIQNIYSTKNSVHLNIWMSNIKLHCWCM